MRHRLQWPLLPASRRSSGRRVSVDCDASWQCYQGCEWRNAKLPLSCSGKHGLPSTLLHEALGTRTSLFFLPGRLAGEPLLALNGNKGWATEPAAEKRGGGAFARSRRIQLGHRRQTHCVQRHAAATHETVSTAWACAPHCAAEACSCSGSCSSSNRGAPAQRPYTLVAARHGAAGFLPSFMGTLVRSLAACARLHGSCDYGSAAALKRCRYWSWAAG